MDFVNLKIDFDFPVQNEALEFERNHERFTFLKWGAKAFKNMLIVRLPKLKHSTAWFLQIDEVYLYLFRCRQVRALFTR